MLLVYWRGDLLDCLWEQSLPARFEHPALEVIRAPVARAPLPRARALDWRTLQHVMISGLLHAGLVLGALITPRKLPSAGQHQPWIAARILQDDPPKPIAPFRPAPRKAGWVPDRPSAGGLRLQPKRPKMERPRPRSYPQRSRSLGIGDLLDGLQAAPPPRPPSALPLPHASSTSIPIGVLATRSTLDPTIGPSSSLVAPGSRTPKPTLHFIGWSRRAHLEQDASGARARALVDEGLEHHMSRLRACGQHTRKSALAAEIFLNFEIQRGLPKAVHLEASEPVPEDLERCLLEVVEMLRFPQLHQIRVQVRYPLYWFNKPGSFRL